MIVSRWKEKTRRDEEMRLGSKVGKLGTKSTGRVRWGLELGGWAEVSQSSVLLLSDQRKKIKAEMSGVNLIRTSTPAIKNATLKMCTVIQSLHPLLLTRTDRGVTT